MMERQSVSRVRASEPRPRNAADALAYQVGQRLRDAGGQLAVHEKARLDQLVGELQRALKEGADLARIRTLADDLRQAATALDTARGRPKTKHHKTVPMS